MCVCVCVWYTCVCVSDVHVCVCVREWCSCPLLLSMTWLIHVWHDWHDSLICDVIYTPVTWLIHMWRDSFTCDVTQSYVTWLTHTWHDSFICDMTPCPLLWAVCLTCTSHMRACVTKMCVRVCCPCRCCYLWHDSFMRDILTRLILMWHHLLPAAFSCMNSIVFVCILLPKNRKYMNERVPLFCHTHTHTHTNTKTHKCAFYCLSPPK